LVAASILRKNPDAEIIPFNNRLHDASGINPRDSVMTNAKKLASMPQGGTDCSLVLNALNEHDKKGDVVIYVSDYESWIDTGAIGYWRNDQAGTKMFGEWQNFKARNPGSRLVCIDLTPRVDTQVKPRPDILQIGGFGDQVFDVVSSFIEYGNSPDHWIEMINGIML
jgi:60 kDa SS-A/Ro ribonucleoprotein